MSLHTFTVDTFNTTFAYLRVACNRLYGAFYAHCEDTCKLFIFRILALIYCVTDLLQARCALVALSHVC